jgi:hypothetical protein
VFSWETPSISFLCHYIAFLVTTRGGTPTPINLSPSFNGGQCHFSLTPVLATHPKNAPVTPFLATHPKTQVFKVLSLPHIQKMAGVGVLLLARNPIKNFGLERKTTGLKTGHYKRTVKSARDGPRPLHEERDDEERGHDVSCPYRGRTSTVIYAAFMWFWRELLAGLIRAELHTLAGIALCPRLVIN